MSDETRQPDAVMIPHAWRGHGNAMQRGYAVLDHADRILGVAQGTAERSHGRPSEGGYFFVTKSPADTLFFPAAHARSGQSRYRWEPQEDGSIHGFLVDDEARLACDPETLRRSFDMMRRTGP